MFKRRVTERSRYREIYLLVPCPDGHNGFSQARPNQKLRESPGSSVWMATAQAFRPSSAAIPGLTGNWIGSGATGTGSSSHMECHCCPYYHNAHPLSLPLNCIFLFEVSFSVYIRTRALNSFVYLSWLFSFIDTQIDVYIVTHVQFHSVCSSVLSTAGQR